MPTMLLTVRQVANLLSVGQAHVLRLIRDGKLRASNVGRGKRPTWRVSQEAVEAYLRGAESVTRVMRTPPQWKRPTQYV